MSYKHWNSKHQQNVQASTYKEIEKIHKAHSHEAQNRQKQTCFEGARECHSELMPWSQKLNSNLNKLSSFQPKAFGRKTIDIIVLFYV